MTLSDFEEEDETYEIEKIIKHLWKVLGEKERKEGRFQHKDQQERFSWVREKKFSNEKIVNVEDIDKIISEFKKLILNFIVSEQFIHFDLHY